MSSTVPPEVEAERRKLLLDLRDFGVQRRVYSGNPMMAGLIQLDIARTRARLEQIDRQYPPARRSR